ncbi:sensor domain-containing diguanylate cyclase [Oceanospirillum sanctuarii]|uniref:sensor domain-containing diguanylate cyclase n=1 Tax=Oceanospirillum sanctuarii TaxID=1434821 RepID=UPI000A368712|nr:GGDEF domain-containing protein [Oceanospirillum sanctuarii]
MDPVLLEKLENCKTLPSLPAVAYQVIEHAKRSDTDSALIAGILEKDPALAAKVVALSNSAANMGARTIDSVKDAITRIGLDMTMTLALSFSFAKAMYDSQTNTMDHQSYWRRCLVSGVLGRVLACKMGQIKPERFFLAGLVQDIGMLALNEIEMDRYGVIFHSADNHSELAKFERSEFGTDHSEVGGWLLDHWGMPNFYVNLVKNSHRSAKEDLHIDEQIVIFSGHFAELWAQDEKPSVMSKLINESNKCKLFNTRQITEIVDEVSAQLPALNEIFETDVQTSFSVGQLIEDAKQQLVVRNMKLMQDLAKARSEASEAKASEEQLKEQLKKDILTGVFNRAYIESISAKAFKHSTENSRPLTVMFLDIDHFKQVNDRYGHQAGDTALKHFARTLVKAAGKGGYVGRYGGEEFVIVMPGVTTDIGLTIAERIRDFLHRNPIKVAAGIMIPICASVGIATHIPGQREFPTAERLMDAADKTMYQAKKSGRDRALVFGAA